MPAILPLDEQVMYVPPANKRWGGKSAVVATDAAKEASLQRDAVTAGLERRAYLKAAPAAAAERDRLENLRAIDRTYEINRLEREAVESAAAEVARSEAAEQRDAAFASHSWHDHAADRGSPASPQGVGWVECTFGADVQSPPPRPDTPPPMRHGGARGVREAEALARSFVVDAELQSLATAPECTVGGARPQVAGQLDDYGRSILPRGVRRTLVYDELGQQITWPWEAGATAAPVMEAGSGGTDRDPCAAYFAEPSHSRDAIGSHRADATLMAGLRAATRDGNMGEKATGVTAWKAFCSRHGRAALRPIDPNAPLWVKLEEEKWVMRFVAGLVDDRNIEPSTARGYFGEASGWHRRRTGIALCGGLNLERLPEMVKGLRRLRDVAPLKVRRGLAPQQLRKALNKVFPRGSAENANVRAALSTALQGLMRGREFCREDDKAFNPQLDLARGDMTTHQG